MLRSIYNGQVVPPFDFVPFSLKPKENKNLYANFRGRQIVELGIQCEREFADQFKEAEKIFNVEREIVLSIILVESHCGRSTGRELVVNRLSRVANVLDRRNLQKNFEKLKRENGTVSFSEMRKRGEYLESVFYPQIKELFHSSIRGNLDIFNLYGSGAGAFGWPQFLPLTYAKYGVDGNRDGRISLYNATDAIYSTAHFFAAHGWRSTLPEKKKREILWQYNKSDPYIDTVLRLSSAFH